MSFYNLSPDKRTNLVQQIESDIFQDLLNKNTENIHSYFVDGDTYIRKSAYLAIGRIYFKYPDIKSSTIKALAVLFEDSDFKVRQTVINALGEIGKKEDEKIWNIFQQGLKDTHPSVRNAVIGSLKKMGEINPKPVIQFSKKHLHNPNPEIRRQVIHGVELRGRTHPEEVLPLLKDVQDEQNKRVRNIIVHVLGQISYKEGCLEKVIADLQYWENKEIVKDALKEIVETHEAYKNFSIKSPKEAQEYIENNIQF